MTLIELGFFYQRGFFHLLTSTQVSRLIHPNRALVPASQRSCQNTHTLVMVGGWAKRVCPPSSTSSAL